MTWMGTAASGNLLWTTDDSDLFNLGKLVGDVVGLAESTIVSGIQGTAVEAAVPSLNQILKFDGSKWALATDATANHNLLSSDHPDTSPIDVSRGALIYGSGVSPAWHALPLGTAEFVLYSDGTDIVYVRLGAVTPFSLGTSSAPSMTFTGDLDTGWSAASPDVMVGSAGGDSLLTLNGIQDSIELNGAQIVKSSGVAVSTTVIASQYLILATANNITVTLPGAPITDQILVVKDRDGLATPAAPITINGNGNTIDGNSFIRIRRAYGSFTLYYNGTTWNVI